MYDNHLSSKHCLKGAKEIKTPCVRCGEKTVSHTRTITGDGRDFEEYEEDLDTN